MLLRLLTWIINFNLISFSFSDDLIDHSLDSNIFDHYWTCKSKVLIFLIFSFFNLK